MIRINLYTNRNMIIKTKSKIVQPQSITNFIRTNIKFLAFLALVIFGTFFIIFQQPPVESDTIPSHEKTLEEQLK